MAPRVTKKDVREIKKFQATTKPLIPKNAIKRFAKAAAKDNTRFSRQTIEALQQGTECHLLDYLNKIQLVATEVGERNVVTSKDMEVIRNIFKQFKD